MIDVHRAAVAALMLGMSCQPVAAQAPFQYREYTLESSAATVIGVSPNRMGDLRTLHQRPASITEVDWRAPYMGFGEDLADPVQVVRFTFYDDRLYQIVVTYDRARMAGLTTDDVIDTLAETYGPPLLGDARTARAVLAADVGLDMGIVAQWEDARSLLTLVRSNSTYSPQFQVVLISKALNAPARAAIVEARRLDTQDAPQREADRRTQAAAAAAAADQRARELNKAAFKP